ncbi:MAG: hypothetical protein Q7O66_00035 [Dehalococcoidia bacterium]|nr:hypothetical protein [Dehalococcoidia bacterium]
MTKLMQVLRTILALSAFFAMVYVNDVWLLIAPTTRLRRWGVTTFHLFQPAWPGGEGGRGRRE